MTSQLRYVCQIDVIGFHSVAYEERKTEGLDRTGVESAHAAGVAVFVWTENDPARQQIPFPKDWSGWYKSRQLNMANGRRRPDFDALNF